MTFIRITLILAFTLTACASKKDQSKTTDLAAEKPAGSLGFISLMKPFTIAGARAGEGYFRADGSMMVFQSEREKGNPFYQIYLMDMKTGESRRVSPGQGKTTCAWVHPNEEKVLFASTHEDTKLKEKVAAEYEERKQPKSRYSWSFDEQYEIYESDWKGRALKNLTNTKGYDAEGSYSPDGKWIAFASNRAAYVGKLSEEDQKKFARDPSYHMDIYIMRADGSEVKRLTTSPGYDGGPFFSPDGKRLTYRHFTPDGKIAEVFTMNVDGSDQKQLTNLGAMSWAPFYHPSGDYLIFATNKLGHANFELYMVDVLGKRDPVRVSDYPGFDGLPVFTPDGLGLLWTHSNEAGEAQLYWGQWNDAKARAALGLPAGKVSATTTLAQWPTENLQKWVKYLTDEKFGGRMTGSATETEYASALAKEFEALGFKPGAGNSFLQTYEFTSGLELGPKNTLTLKEATTESKLGLETDYVPLSISKTGTLAAGELIFAGYGIVAPASGGQTAYDSFENLDLKDKWAVVFAGLPNGVSNERRFFLNIYSRLPHKALMARQRGARGLIVINDSQTPDTALKLKYEGRADDSGLAVFRLSDKFADGLFQRAGTSRKIWTDKLARGDKGFFKWNETTLAGEIDLKFKKSKAVNVLAVWPAPKTKNTVVVGAHLDHLGLGEGGNSLAPKSHAPHVGADDNASGVSAVMEMAKSISQKIKYGEIKPKQNILLGLWTGEEIGILGSSHFLKENKAYKITSYLNLDMVGRLRDAVAVQGVASAQEWKSLIEPLNAKADLTLRTQDDPYVPTDALAFYLKEIPSITFFTGSHAQYHTPDDKESLINYQGLSRISALVENITVKLASSSKSLVTYQKVEGKPRDTGARGFRLYLGTIPDYTQESKKGVLISGTSKDSPAEKAGLKPGDVITELGGIKIQNINDYVYCLQALKANEVTKMRVLRAGKETEMVITPALKSAQ